MASDQVDSREIHPDTQVTQLSDQEDEDASGVEPELLIKHPLQNKWALWFYKHDKNKDWAANLRLITSFDTVEDFWALYNHVQAASKLPPGCDYSMFKDGVEPMWEDARNRNGGRWLINLDRRQRQSDLDNFWLETLLCLIGEAFEDYSDEICGAVVNIRNKGDKLGLWTRNAQKHDATVSIGRKLKKRLKVPDNLQIGYQSHQDTMSKSGSTTKNRYQV